MFFFVSPNIKNLGKTVAKSFLLSTAIILLSLFLLFGIIPYPSITEHYFPMYELSRLISYGRFIQRVDSIFMLIWLLATFIYLSVAVTFAIHIMKKLFNITYFKRLIPSMAILIMSISLLLSSYITILEIKKILLKYVVPIGLFLYPFIILIIATIKQRWRKNEETS